MSIVNLDVLFRPKSVALIGASPKPGSVGAVLAANLLRAGFAGPVMPVSPRHQAVAGVLAYPDVASLPVTPDLAVVCTPPDTVPDIVSQLATRGTRAAVIITAGFGEGDNIHGKDLLQKLLDAAAPTRMRIIGPNCLGVMASEAGLNASFSQLSPRPGRLAFVAQSGAIVTSVLDWADRRGIGFSHMVSLGDMADVDFGDMLDYLANQPGTRAILLYIEAVTHARKFLSAARAAARMKPVIVVKSGRHSEGARAAASHTGALAGADAVYDAVFRRAGMLRVHSLDELFDAVEILSVSHPPRGDRLAILSNGGGIGVLATDALMDEGGRLAALGEETLAALDKVLPATWSRSNPIDIIGDADGKRYAESLDALLADPGVDATLVLNCPTAVASGAEAARAVLDVVARRGPEGGNVLTSWVGDSTAQEARRLFSDARVPTYATPEHAVHAFMYLVNHRRGQDLLMQTPPSVPEEFQPETDRVRAVIDQCLAKGREWLNEPEAKEVLDAYGIPVVTTRIAATADEAAARAAAMGGPVALKILAPDITHKSDVGGVALDLAGPAQVHQAALDMLERVARTFPEARIDGFTVQPMVRRPGAHELIVGVTNDVQFGPVVLFGQGGTAVEVLDDKALGLPPLNMRLARELISGTRVSRLLAGYRDRPAANLDALALTLIKVAQLVTDFGEILELDINPLLADEYGVFGLDARVRLAPWKGRAADRLAIRPYPKELEEDIPLGDGRTLWLRPVVPEDEPALQRTFARLTPDEIRLRFFVPMKTMSHVQAARFTQIDYDREMALILTEHGIPGTTDIHGVVRLSADPNNERAEYAILVHHAMTGLGLSIVMMRRIIDHARSRGIREIFGDVLRENATMLKLCKALRFRQSNDPDDPSIVRVSLEL